MRYKTFTILPILILLFGGCGLIPTNGPVAEEIIHSYQEMHLLTPQPLVVDIGLCRMPISGIDTLAHAPHYQPLNIYANKQALAALAQPGARNFPAGSVIVKEKVKEDRVALAQDRESGGLPVPKDLGIMIKREEGFNPEGGDWEYAYWEKGKLYRNQDELQHCQACHTTGQAASLPFVEERLETFGVILNRQATDSVFFVFPQANTQ